MKHASPVVPKRMLHAGDVNLGCEARAAQRNAFNAGVKARSAEEAAARAEDERASEVAAAADLKEYRKTLEYTAHPVPDSSK